MMQNSRSFSHVGYESFVLFPAVPAQNELSRTLIPRLEMHLKVKVSLHILVKLI